MTPKAFWPAVAVGWSVALVGIVGILGEGRDVPVAAFVRWIVGAAVVHDLVLVPVVLAVGVALARFVGAPWRAEAGAALVVAGPVLLFAWPFVAGWGRSASNRSVQPRAYGAGLVTILAIVAIVTVAVGVIEKVRRGRAG